ncbi:hypothetical protein LLEC1_00683 [Akanthomyces lecanii]|uniref:Uncharacterized protein n=1 Tax=Cordyceps confragosa TaxID=2714763 RepID=A0A179IGQ4_CORDF|nr:hypothetical protein LLEC1_00683 [Akanthomyces lecanii]
MHDVEEEGRRAKVEDDDEPISREIDWNPSERCHEEDVGRQRERPKGHVRRVLDGVEKCRRRHEVLAARGMSPVLGRLQTVLGEVSKVQQPQDTDNGKRQPRQRWESGQHTRSVRLPEPEAQPPVRVHLSVVPVSSGAGSVWGTRRCYGTLALVFREPDVPEDGYYAQNSK